MNALELLADRYAFDSTPPFESLGQFHVPFDDLTSSRRVEARLDASIRRGERCAVIAPSGSGKSSVLSYLLGPLVEEIAPIFVPVAASPADHVTDPLQLAGYLINVVGQAARHAIDEAAVTEAQRQAADRTVTTSSTRRRGIKVGWRWLSGDLAREIDAQTRVEMPATIIDRTDALSQLRAVAADGLTPVLVFDDSDRWLSVTSPETVRAFFTEALRWLTELPATVVATVHPHYFDQVPRDVLLATLDTQVELPALADPAAAIEQILQLRIRLHADGDVTVPAFADVFTRSALDELVAVYEESRSLRRVVQLAHIALAEALLVPVDQVDAPQIQSARNAG